ncbi:hypothetical protein [Shewanella algae]
MDKLKTRADSAEADAQLEYYKQIEELRSCFWLKRYYCRSTLIQ